MAKKAKPGAKEKKTGPKYERVKAWLRQKIESGEYPAGKRLPTQTQLPRILKVGGVTVRRALNDLAKEGLIVQKRRAGSFVADQKHPPLIPGRNLHLGLLWNEDVSKQAMRESLVGAMTQGVLAEWGVETAVPDWDPSGRGRTTGCTWTQLDRGLRVSCIGQYYRSRERHPPLETVKRCKFDGIITMSIIEEDWLKKLLDMGIPTVLADFPLDSFRHRCDQVYADPMPGFRLAIEQLVEQGARQIHFLGAYHRMPAENEYVGVAEWLAATHDRMRADPDSLLRLSAYRQALDGCGLTVRDDFIHFSPYEEKSVGALADQLARLPDDRRPDAVVCHATALVDILSSRLTEKGVKVLTTGATFRPYVGPSIPIHLSCEEMGAVAADLLISRLQKPHRPWLKVGVAMELERRVRNGKR